MGIQSQICIILFIVTRNVSNRLTRNVQLLLHYLRHDFMNAIVKRTGYWVWV